MTNPATNLCRVVSWCTRGDGDHTEHRRVTEIRRAAKAEQGDTSTVATVTLAQEGDDDPAIRVRTTDDLDIEEALYLADAARVAAHTLAGVDPAADAEPIAAQLVTAQLGGDDGLTVALARSAQLTGRAGYALPYLADIAAHFVERLAVRVGADPSELWQALRAAQS